MYQYQMEQTVFKCGAAFAVYQLSNVLRKHARHLEARGLHHAAREYRATETALRAAHKDHSKRVNLAAISDASDRVLDATRGRK